MTEVEMLDCRGMRCPRPVIELARRMRGAAEGTTVLVLADDVAAAVDIPAWCRMRAHEFLGTESVAGSPAYRVRKISAST